MGASEHQRWESWIDEDWVEKRPPRKPLTDAEKLAFLGEYVERYEYKDRFFVIFDCLGQKTEEMDLGEAIETAAARFQAANE